MAVIIEPASVIRTKDPSYVEPAKVYKYLTDKGIPDTHARGILFNIAHESGFASDISETNPVVKGSKGGYGLFQHTGPRRELLERYLKDDKTNKPQWQKQIDFIFNADTEYDRNILKQYLSTDFKDVGSAGAWFFKKWERSADAQATTKDEVKDLFSRQRYGPNVDKKQFDFLKEKNKTEGGNNMLEKTGATENILADISSLSAGGMPPGLFAQQQPKTTTTPITVEGLDKYNKDLSDSVSKIMGQSMLSLGYGSEVNERLIDTAQRNIETGIQASIATSMTGAVLMASGDPNAAQMYAGGIEGIRKMSGRHTALSGARDILSNPGSASKEALANARSVVSSFYQDYTTPEKLFKGAGAISSIGQIQAAMQQLALTEISNRTQNIVRQTNPQIRDAYNDARYYIEKGHKLDPADDDEKQDKLRRAFDIVASF